MMRFKHIFTLFTLFISITVSAQTIETSVITDFNVIRENQHFSVGDKVSIVGYKYKHQKNHFAIITDNYAGVISISTNPFDVTEKQLKKLPNALSEEMSQQMQALNTQIIQQKQQQRKDKALRGDIRVVLTNDITLRPEEDAFGTVSVGDTLHILGYSSSVFRKYALYTNNAAGVFELLGYGGSFEKYLNHTDLPSIDDTDVRIVLKQKQNEFIQSIRNDAIKGSIRGTISYLTSFYDENHRNPFSYGDTVSIIGYNKTEGRSFYALASPKGVGIYNTSTYSNPFKEKINVSALLPTDHPDVKEVLLQLKEHYDSINNAKIAALKDKLIEQRRILLDLYAKNEPVLIFVKPWRSNSVGKIDVPLEVTNLSPSLTIKYISFQGYFTNPVGDKCHNEIGGGTVWKGRGVGPIYPRPTSLENFEERQDDCEASYDFDNNSFYSQTAEYFHLSSVTIQYTNGRTITLSGANLDKHVRYE